MSVTWYTWLEQGRGGPPSDEVLERLVHALELDAANREVLFLLARQRPPPLHPTPPPVVAPALQAVLDALPTSPAYVKTRTWDIVAWNRAATVVLTDYPALSVHERNTLRRLFGNPAMRAALPDWEENVRFVLSVFRIDVTRAGGCPEAVALAAELHEKYPEFRRFWAENDVRHHGAGRKRLQHAVAGPLTLDYTAFSVDGADGLRSDRAVREGRRRPGTQDVGRQLARGEELEEPGVRLGAVDDALLEDEWVVLLGRGLERVGVEEDLLLPGARPLAQPWNPAVLRREAIGGDGVLAAGPAASGVLRTSVWLLNTCSPRPVSPVPCARPARPARAGPSWRAS